MPNLARKASYKSIDNFSAPVTTIFRDLSSSRVAFLRNGRIKVGAPTMTVACSCWIASTIFFVSSGLGNVIILQPRNSGYQSVTVEPKAWNTGRHAIMMAVFGKIESDEI